MAPEPISTAHIIKSLPSVCLSVRLPPPPTVARQRLVKHVPTAPNKEELFLIPFYLQAVQIHSANGIKLLEA
jgi:hypothetical protein